MKGTRPFVLDFNGYFWEDGVMNSTKNKQKIYAFIDSQNLNLSIRELGWRLDFVRFRRYLLEKYGVSSAFLFIGFVEGNEKLYTHLQKAGFICVFKPTLKYADGSTKGNCDAELVLQTMFEYSNFDKAIIASGDGDFYCLVKYLAEKQKLSAVIVPNQDKCSALLKFKICRPYLRFMNELKDKLGYKEKAP